MNKKSISGLIFMAVILSSLIFIMGIDRQSYATSPKTVYQVYLSGKQIGVIEDEQELYDLIDKEQESLKKEYNVSKVYAPVSLETTKLLTYSGVVDDVKSVYEKIKDVEPFTIKGYEVTIYKDEDNIEKINVLNLDDFDASVENTILAYVDKDKYEAYLNSSQESIITTGSRIENISIRENITTKEMFLPTDEKIFTNSKELSQYLLFGSLETQGTHIVRNGETIKDIANDYQLSVMEFLIVNPDIISENALLFNGQVVNVGIINPLISVAVEESQVEDKEVTYSTEVKYDNKFIVGTTYTEQKGQNGVSRVSYYTETVNGFITNVVLTNTEVITPVVNEVIVKGGLSINYVGETGSWYWPTLQPYVLTSEFGWRPDPWGTGSRVFHSGIDISGTGYASPIYAAGTGVIVKLGYSSGLGNYLTIKHNDTYTTEYGHLAYFADGLRVGSAVSKGQTIAYMGSTGDSTGTHLHFSVIINGEYVDPWILYR